MTTVLCGSLRVQIRPCHAHAYEHAAEQLHLCSEGLAGVRWSPRHHRSYPLQFRSQVHAVLLCARRSECLLNMLPEETLLLVIESLAELTFWSVQAELTSAMSEIKQLSV